MIGRCVIRIAREVTWITTPITPKEEIGSALTQMAIGHLHPSHVAKADMAITVRHVFQIANIVMEKGLMEKAKARESQEEKAKARASQVERQG